MVVMDLRGGGVDDDRVLELGRDEVSRLAYMKVP